MATWADVCGRRLERHGLLTPLEASPADVAAAVCGIHAQVISAAELSVGVRQRGTTRTDVRSALWEERSLVKTFGPRGTVHLLAARDLPMWTGALGSVPLVTSMPEGMRMTAAQTDAVVEAIGVALADGELTVDELSDAVVATAGPWAGDLVMPAFQGMWPRWRQAIPTAAHRGVLCAGPERGRLVTYTHPRRWLPGFTPDLGPSALRALLRRYLQAYGPATPAQLAQWLAAPRLWAAALFETHADELEQVDVEGSGPAWQLAGESAGSPTDGVRLLPYFDAYTVGCHPRSLLFPGAAAERALKRGQAGTYPVVLVGGVVAGVWHHRRSGRRLDVTVEPLGPLTSSQEDELEDQVRRVGEVLEASPRLTVGTVSARSHL